MSRYIDSEELKHKLNASNYYGKKAARDFCDMIVECETADVVDVVRCGQCCNADIRCDGLYCYCTLHEEYRTLDYFCASGGKKDEEDIENAHINL